MTNIVGMTYPDFVDPVLRAATAATEDYSARLTRATNVEVIRRLGTGVDASAPEFWNSDTHLALLDAAHDLELFGIVDGRAHLMVVSDAGRDIGRELRDATKRHRVIQTPPPM